MCVFFFFFLTLPSTGFDTFSIVSKHPRNPTATKTNTITQFHFHKGGEAYRERCGGDGGGVGWGGGERVREQEGVQQPQNGGEAPLSLQHVAYIHVTHISLA